MGQVWRSVAHLLDGLAADWKQARRSVAGSPLTTAATLATLTAAVALATAVFSLVSSILLRPLPYPDSDRLVRLSEFRPDRPGPPVAGGNLMAVTVGLWQRESKTLDAIVPYSLGHQTVGAGERSEQLLVAAVGSPFFEIVGARPAEGRLLVPADHARDAPPVAVVSRSYWTEVLGRQPNVVGSIVTIESVPHVIVGVAPDDIGLPVNGIALWTPGRWRWPIPDGGSQSGAGSIAMSIATIGRVRSGVTLEEVQREGERIVTQIAFAHPAFADGTVPIPSVRVTRLQDLLTAEARPALSALFVGMALVLAAACASLANLVVARSTARGRDLAIRVTLGAGRRQLIPSLFLEYSMLAAGGAVLGGLGGWWALRLLPVLGPESLPRLTEVRFDWWMWIAAAAAAGLTTIVVGVRPGWRQPGWQLRQATAGERLTSRRGSLPAEVVRAALATSQVALAVILLVGASLIGRSVLHLIQTPPGYRAEGALTFQVGHHPRAYRDAGRLTQFYGQLIERIRALPGVTAVGVASKLPLHGFAFLGSFVIEGNALPLDPADRPRAHMHMITGDYLAALGTRLLEGRGFGPGDQSQSMPVVLVSELLSRRYFEGQALGRRIRGMGGKTWTVVGVVENVKLETVRDDDEPIIYYPSSQVGEILAYSRTTGGVIVRTAADPAVLVSAIRQQVRELDPSAPVFNAMPLDERLGRTFDQPRFFAVAIGLFAALTLVTAVLGVYGVQAFTVERRRVEFGVRRALGAGERHILGLVLKRAAVVGALGVAIGTPAAAAGAGLLRSMLFGIGSLDPITFGGVPTLLFVVVLAASWQPALSALRSDPAQALKSE